MFFFMIRDDPSRSESIRVVPTRTGGPSWSGPTFVPALSGKKKLRIQKYPDKGLRPDTVLICFGLNWVNC